jgi:cytochrome b561
MSVAISRVSTPSYDGVQRAFHWIMAAVIFLAIAAGVGATFLEKGSPERAQVFMIHRSLGMTALALVAFRVVYRLIAGAPPHTEPLGRLTNLAAHAGHLALYFLMIALPVTGYLLTAAAGRPVPWFGLFEWPNFAPQDKALAASASQAHYWLAWAIGAVLVLHLAAVVWHRYVKRDGVLARMWP